MIRFYMTGERVTWIPIPDSPDVRERVLALGAKKLSILAVSENPDDVGPTHVLRYRGPLYFDIDDKQDRGEAIRSAKTLARTLRDAYKVPEKAIWPFLSGSKGVHILVPETVFSSGRAYAQLPKIYMEMAAMVAVPGLDFSPYSGGKGNCFRIDNIQRESGTFRVPLSYQELQDLREEDYDAMVSAARPQVVREDCSDVKSVELGLLFDRAKALAKKHERTGTGATQKELDKLQGQPPECINMLADGKVQSSAQYNQIAMQVAVWIARAGIDETTQRAIITRVSDNNESSQYGDRRRRYQHAKGLVGYMEKNEDKAFLCPAMRGLCKGNPCAGCPLETEKQTEQDLAEDTGLVEAFGRYQQVVGPDKYKSICNFTLEVHAVITDGKEIESGSEFASREAAVITIVDAEGNHLSQRQVEETAWASKNGFLGIFAGLGSTMFYGTESDIQKIKGLIFSKEPVMGNVYREFVCGIQFKRLPDGRHLRTYTEPGWSINHRNVENTAQFSGHMLGEPHMKDVATLQAGDADAAEGVKALLKMTRAAEAGLLAGWVVAAHFRQHFHIFGRQFPLLSASGARGAGKTTLVNAVMPLAGIDSAEGEPLMNVAVQKTQFPIMEFLSSTTTVPRILDEFNNTMKRGDLYDQITELLKGCWNQHSAHRGTIHGKAGEGRSRSGAYTNDFPLSAPVVVLGEQPPTLPALVQRSVMITVRETFQDADALMTATMQTEAIRRVGKAIMRYALKLDPADLQKLFLQQHALVPKDMPTRPRYAYGVVLTGLAILRKVCQDYQLDVDAEIQATHAAAVKWLQDQAPELAKAKARTEVDIVLDKIFEIIEMGEAGVEANLPLAAGKQWAVTELSGGTRILCLDAPIAHTVYRRYCQKYERGVPALDQYSTFLQQLQEEPYLHSAEMLAPDTMMLSTPRPVIGLDVEKMIAKGLHLARRFA